ncbi:FHA domain-containing protein [Propionivibrio sp.]|uniref:FHA domain-containing protein n=1 Tax=Propionivibrio sp. TaxID=2212460 RepID=UPI00260EE4C0|nr:FHA domain-containing protein [Propionivibrio sp.]
MAKLILSMDGLVLKEITLTKERMSIGRKASNDIQIDNLAISGEHAAVVTILNDSFLEDLNSTNGTLVNGQPAKKHFLQNGDVIELGKYKLKYVAEHVQKIESTDFEKTMLIRPKALKQAPTSEALSAAAAAAVKNAFGNTSAGQASSAAAAAQPQPTYAAVVTGAIQILNGANAGRELELTKTLTTLGKPGVQVAVIARRPHGYFITHVEGGQHPVLNGQEIEAQAHQLADHDVIEIAGIKMEFFLKS